MMSTNPSITGKNINAPIKIINLEYNESTTAKGYIEMNGEIKINQKNIDLVIGCRVRSYNHI